MQIEIPIEQYEMLTAKAHAAGYQDVTHFIQALAGEPAADPRGPLNEAELCESVLKCEQANAEIEAGGGRDAREALLELGQELGFKRPE